VDDFPFHFFESEINHLVMTQVMPVYLMIHPKLKIVGEFEFSRRKVVSMAVRDRRSTFVRRYKEFATDLCAQERATVCD
jgi:hypothetical protein